MTEADGSSLRGLIRRTSGLFARRRVVLLTTLGGLLLADALVALSVAAEYRSTASIAVEPARLPDGVAPVAPSVQKRLEQLTTLATEEPAFLAELAQARHLAHPRTPFDVLAGEPASPIERLRQRLSVKTSGKSGERTLIEIASTGDDPHGVADVTSRVAARLLARDREDRTA